MVLRLAPRVKSEEDLGRLRQPSALRSSTGCVYYLARTRIKAVARVISMDFMRFWSDLSMWNRFGIAAVGAIVIILVIGLILL